MRIISYLNISVVCLFLFVPSITVDSRKLRSVDNQDTSQLGNSVEYIWSVTTVALGDTAVLHCSFDAIFQQLRNGNIEWFKEQTTQQTRNKKADTKVKRHNPLDSNVIVQEQPKYSFVEAGEWELTGATPLVSGKKVVVGDGRFRVYRPHNSALSVLIIRRTKKKDAGIYRCNLAGSSTRHRYMILNVTESKIEAQTSPATVRVKIGSDVMLWCNATGYPKPVVYWTREDRNRKLPDGSSQFWGNGLRVKGASEQDSGVYACFLDNFVQPIVSYKFSLMVEDNPWNLDGFKMRFDSKQWHPIESLEPRPVKSKSFLLMCETRGAYKPLPVIRWYKNGKALKNSKFFYIIESPEVRSTHTSSTLVIMNFLQRFSGDYTCVASNVFRMKKLTFSVKAARMSTRTLTRRTNALSPEDIGEKLQLEDHPDATTHHHVDTQKFIGKQFSSPPANVKPKIKFNNKQPATTDSSNVDDDFNIIISTTTTTTKSLVVDDDDEELSEGSGEPEVRSS